MWHQSVFAILFLWHASFLCEVFALINGADYFTPTAIGDAKQCQLSLWNSFENRLSKLEDTQDKLILDIGSLKEAHSECIAAVTDIQGELNETAAVVQQLAEYKHSLEWLEKHAYLQMQRPSFTSEWFTMKSQDDEYSEIAIAHGLGTIPVKVDVLITPIEGVNAGWKFPGDAAFQTDDELEHAYGGVVYLYNETHVLLFAPNRANNKNDGRIIYTGSQGKKRLGKYHQASQSAWVKVKVWDPDDVPVPDFTSDWLPIDITNKSRTFYDIEHGLGDYPALVTVQVRPGKSSLIADTVGTTVKYRSYVNGGGVVSAFNDKSVRVWSSYFPDQSSGTRKGYGKPICSNDGWGKKWSLDHEGVSGNTATFRVQAWARKTSLLNEYFVTESTSTNTEFEFPNGQGPHSDQDLLTCYTEATAGPNKGYRFAGKGGAQDEDAGYGGAIFAYDDLGHVRAWPPNAATKGHLIYVSKPYGNGEKEQVDDSGKLLCTLLKTLNTH